MKCWPTYDGTPEERVTYLAEDGPRTVELRGSEASSSLTWTPLTSNTIGLPPGVDPTQIYPADLASWGLDQPPRFVVALDGDGEGLDEWRIEHGDREVMEEFFGLFAKDTDVVMEARFDWPWIADAAEAMGMSGHLAHALRAREFANGPVIIDCCPLLNVLSLNAVFACDLLLVPVSADFLALQGAKGVDRALDALGPVFRHRLPRRYVLTRYDGRRRMSGEVAERMAESLRPEEICATRIRESVKLAESPWVVDVQTDGDLTTGKPRRLFEKSGYSRASPIRSWDLSLDSERFLMVKFENREPAPVTEMILVHNWFEELKRLVPTGKGASPGN